jgi:hypothetical protein
VLRIQNRLLRIRIHCFGRTPIRIRIQGFCDQHKKLQYTYPSTSKHEITLVIFLWVIFALLDVDPTRTRNTAYVDICSELLATLLYLYDPSWRLPGVRLLPGQKSLAENTSRTLTPAQIKSIKRCLDSANWKP